MRNMKEFYRAKYKGDLFVVKAGGRIISDDEARLSLLSNIQDLTQSGIKILLIYGGGHMIDAAMKEANLEITKVDGRRITRAQDIKIIKGVMAGDLSYRVGATLAEMNFYGLCLSHIPAAWTDIKKREPFEGQERYDGTINSVNGEAITKLFERVNFVAVPCLGVTPQGGVNINADDVAVAIATGTKARKLILLSDVDGVIKDGKTLPYITDKEIPELIADGTVSGGMRVKLENCIRALDNGVRRIHLLNGFVKDILAQEIYESIGPTTMIIREEDRQSYLNEVKAQKLFEEGNNNG